ncbi:MAG: hypothetical protein HC934_02260 [Acaryochloridaceae cyanobacterium SU_2_1]|nr:hypothetical protein [Acaryochloridaceae cyanobacterium SU_2_1]
MISSGVCIGIGVILKAYDGNIEIDSGVNLGAGVLIVGSVKIGGNACIGESTTIFNTNIQPMQIVPAASLMGNSGRQVLSDSESSTSFSHNPQPSKEPRTQQLQPSYSQPSYSQPSYPPSYDQEQDINVQGQFRHDIDRSNTPSYTSNSEKHSSTVIGRAYVKQLIGIIFPQNSAG